MAKPTGVTEARDELGDTVDRVARNGQRATLTRRGKAVAAIVSTDDLELLEALEERRTLKTRAPRCARAASSRWRG